jgi:uncharacterized protein YbjT (DUF2867 family)
MKALVIGATGATGQDLIDVLLHDTAYTEVVGFVRRTGNVQHPKLKEIITDFDQLDAVAAEVNGHVLFSCLGTTLKTAGSKEKQWHIDYEIPLRFAEIAKRNGVSCMVLLSSYGATSASKVFYSKMKGSLEDAIDALGFLQYIIFRPGLLLRKDTDRPGEKTSAAVLKFFNRIGLFMKFQPMPTRVLAEKMAKAPRSSGKGRQVIELEKIFSY